MEGSSVSPVGPEGGKRLDLWLDEAPRSWRAVAEVFVQVGRALAADHERRVVHEEVKLENVFVREDGSVTLADLRAAVALPPPAEPGLPEEGVKTAASSLEQRLTAADTVGAASYVAPEQFRGREAEAASNQFSFCVALYRALYRQVPFDPEWSLQQSAPRRTPLGSVHFQLLVASFGRMTLANLAREVMAGNVRPPPPHSDVPVWLDLVVRRGLSADAVDRYPSMNELVGAIVSKLGSTPAVGPSGATTRAPRFRMKWPIVAGAAIGLLLLLGLIAKVAGTFR